VDRAVADIVDAMSRTGRLANAVIIFTGDNGWALGTHRWTWKSCSYEDCIKQPLLIWAPGIAPRNEAALASNIDLAPTIAEFAGVTPPPGFVNGRSLVPLLTNPGTSWRDALLIEYLGAVVESKQRFSGVRTSRYMYAEYQNGDKELYDLNVDPFELVNVIDDPDYNTVESNLRAQLQDLKAD
jgi:arylsulfatase A-like enzyme